MKFHATIAILFLAAQSLISLPAEIIIIRHAEKPDEPEAQHLSKQGEERAKALVGFFTKNPQVIEHGLPAALFASAPTHKGSGQRPRETLQPTARELHLSIETPFEGKEYLKLAELLRKSSRYEGKTVVVCWVHESIPQLAAALGVAPEPPKWKEHVYDEAYLITYPAGKAHLKIVPERLLPEDSKHKK